MKSWVHVAVWSLLVGGSALAQETAGNQSASDEMAKARAELKHHHGDQLQYLALVERLEYQSDDGADFAVLEGQAWIGGDLNKLWLKTDGAYDLDQHEFDDLELQLLYSRAISPYWDLQSGIRHDFEPDSGRSYATIGVQGLAPQWFEIDAAFFISDQGDLSLRFESEYELRLSQRLYLQPRVELNAAFSDDRENNIGSGLSDAEAGLRLRFEIRREFAPYVGFNWRQSFGRTRDLEQADGADVDTASWVAGVRFWF